MSIFKDVNSLSTGPPPPKPHTSYGPPKPSYQAPLQLKPFYGPPLKPAVNFKPQQTYGLPLSPIRQPLPAYGPPTVHVQNSPPSFPQAQSYPPAHISHGPSFPQPIKGAGCDGWKPIPGPSIGTQQGYANSNTATIESIAPENNYLPPVASNALPVTPDNSYLPPISSNSLAVADTLTVQPLPTNLQLPVAEATNFNNHANLGSDIASGLGLTSINVVKSEGIEVCSLFLLNIIFFSWILHSSGKECVFEMFIQNCDDFEKKIVFSSSFAAFKQLYPRFILIATCRLICTWFPKTTSNWSNTTRFISIQL